MSAVFELGAMNHVGVAVPSIEKAIEHYARVFDVIATPIKELPEQGVKVAFINLPTGQVELIEPLGEKSPINKFLERNPLGGQHHICSSTLSIATPALPTSPETRGWSLS